MRVNMKISNESHNNVYNLNQNDQILTKERFKFRNQKVKIFVVCNYNDNHDFRNHKVMEVADIYMLMKLNLF